MLLNTVSKNTLIKSKKNQSPVIAVIYLLLNISFQDQKLSSMSQNYDHVDYSLFSHKGSKNDNKIWGMLKHSLWPERDIWYIQTTFNWLRSLWGCDWEFWSSIGLRLDTFLQVITSNTYRWWLNLKCTSLSYIVSYNCLIVFIVYVWQKWKCNDMYLIFQLFWSNAAYRFYNIIIFFSF